MDSNERVIQALHEFENMTDADKVLTQELEDLFIQIAHTGRIQIPWIYLKPVFMFKLDKVMRDFFESSPSRNNTSSEPTHTAEFDVMRQRLLDCIESFTGAPFTVQRLCELMVEPKRHYRNSEKFMRGVEKNILVVSTMSDIEGQELPNCQENDTIPNGPVTNGIITTGSTTEMSSISDECCESNGQHQEHYHDTHYPTLGTTLQINGNGTLEKRNDDSTESTETELSEDKLSETPPAESSDAEKSLPESEEKRTDDSDNNGSGDSSDSFSEETAEEQQSNVTSEQDEKNTEDKDEKCSERIEENESGDDKEDVKQDSQEQKDTKCEERIENKQVQEEKEEDKKDEEEASTEEPMEE